MEQSRAGISSVAELPVRVSDLSRQDEEDVDLWVGCRSSFLL